MRGLLEGDRDCDGDSNRENRRLIFAIRRRGALTWRKAMAIGRDSVARCRGKALNASH